MFLNNSKKEKELEILKERGIIFIGEIHGSNQNVDLIIKFVKKLKPRQIFLEWHPEWLNQFGGKKKISPTEDGRITEYHPRLINFLKSKKIKIYCIDTYRGNDWNARDKTMEENIRRTLKKNKNGISLVVVGKIHARKRVFSLKQFNNYFFRPLRSYFKSEQALSVGINFGCGSVYNFGIKKFKNKNVVKKLQKRKNLFLRSQSRYFDFEYLIRESYSSRK